MLCDKGEENFFFTKLVYLCNDLNFFKINPQVRTLGSDLCSLKMASQCRSVMPFTRCISSTTRHFQCTLEKAVQPLKNCLQDVMQMWKLLGSVHSCNTQRSSISPATVCRSLLGNHPQSSCTHHQQSNHSAQQLDNSLFFQSLNTRHQIIRLLSSDNKALEIITGQIDYQRRYWLLQCIIQARKAKNRCPQLQLTAMRLFKAKQRMGYGLMRLF